MEIIWFVVLSGLLGGLVIAGMARLKTRRPSLVQPDAFADRAITTDVINIANIRVAGIGGLGLVAMAAVVALALPQVGRSLVIGLTLGAALAGLLILARRRTGSMPSSSRNAGAHALLPIDRQPRPVK